MESAIILRLREENALLAARCVALESENAALKDRLSEIERRLGLHSGNSGKPPSSDGLARPARTGSLRGKSGKKMGGQAGHAGATLERVASPDAVSEHRPEACSGCGESLREAEDAGTESRQVFEISAPVPVVTEHRAPALLCPRCGLRNKADFPKDVGAPVQYGPRVKAAASYLSAVHFIPEKRRSDLFGDLFGLPVSAASLAGFDAQAAEILAPRQEAVLAGLKAAPVKHLDETGVRIGGKTEWLHVVGNGEATHYRVSPKRGDLLSGVSGIAVHDHWRPYFTMEGVTHALCNAHILRELKALIDVDKEPWAKRMARLLRRACRVAKACSREGGEGAAGPPRETLRRLYDRIAAKGKAFHESLPPFAAPPKRGMTKRRPGHNLARRLERHKEDVLRFLADPAVPFTNNRAEQDIRMMKVKQKVSGGFRTVQGAEIFCILRGFLSTAKKQGHNPFVALAEAMA
jgi:transposase